MHEGMTSVSNVNLNNGIKIPILGLGTFQNEKCDHENIRNIVNTALEYGYRHIDTATLYQNEAMIGDCLREWLSSGKIKRDELFVTTKLPMIGNRPQDVNKFLRLSLQNLQLTYVDLYLIHMPVGMIGKDETDVRPKDDIGNTVLDHKTNLEELYGAVEEQVDIGLAKSVGLSNFNSQQIERIMKVCRIKPVVLQVEVHAYHQQKELREICKRHEIHVCAFAPLGAPYKFRESDTKESFPVLLEHPVVTSVASRYKKSPSQILLRFLIQNGIIAIPGAPTPMMLLENIQVFCFELTPSDMTEIEKLDRGRDGKMFYFEFYKGISQHAEYPFGIPY
ncbi:hypothetical protein SK128_001807 [Halocaridina rubra]|uniref:NADP-dependent oxidoreductase domain-containing protein n=1 Tax=Halocaridina rubra TaxID=373956 RepID=A0AAN9A3G3_HALRR